MPNSGASNRFAVWGHSQGGHAALYTGEVAARYAPELKLVGVAAAAPATYLVELFDADESTEQDLVAMTVLSWSRLENIPVTNIVEPEAMPAFEATARDCIESVAEFEKIEKDESPLQSGEFLKVDPAKAEPWKGIMQRNTPGQAPAGAPVFIAQGTADTTVEPAITKRFGEALVRPRRARELRRASRRDAYLRRARQRERRAAMDDRSLPRSAGAVETARGRNLSRRGSRLRRRAGLR